MDISELLYSSLPGRRPRTTSPIVYAGLLFVALPSPPPSRVKNAMNLAEYCRVSTFKYFMHIACSTGCPTSN